LIPDDSSAISPPGIEKKWREMALTPVGGAPGEVGAFLKAARWRQVIVSGGIKRQ
jgi:hypothetical protein